MKFWYGIPTIDSCIYPKNCMLNYLFGTKERYCTCIVLLWIYLAMYCITAFFVLNFIHRMFLKALINFKNLNKSTRFEGWIVFCLQVKESETPLPVDPVDRPMPEHANRVWIKSKTKSSSNACAKPLRQTRGSDQISSVQHCSGLGAISSNSSLHYEAHCLEQDCCLLNMNDSYDSVNTSNN
jgi:hypothetical protein